MVPDLTGSSSAHNGVHLPGMLDNSHEGEGDAVAVGRSDHGAEHGVEEVEVAAEEDRVQAVETHKGSVELVHVANAIRVAVAGPEKIAVVAVRGNGRLTAAAVATAATDRRKVPKRGSGSPHQFLTKLRPPLTAPALAPSKISSGESLSAVMVSGGARYRVVEAG